MLRESIAGKQSTKTTSLVVDDKQQISLCEVLDRVLNKGIVLTGEATISVADIDLVYLGLQMILTSIETRRQSVRFSPLEVSTASSTGEEWPGGIA